MFTGSQRGDRTTVEIKFDAFSEVKPFKTESCLSCIEQFKEFKVLTILEPGCDFRGRGWPGVVLIVVVLKM